MDKLSTFGCSFTKNVWPTWADYAGCYYSQFVNYGDGGSGNRQIFNKIIENLEKIKKGTVIVEWSSFIREDRILPREKLELFDRGYQVFQWVGTGPMHVSNRVVNDNFRSFWTPYQTVLESTNYVIAACELLKSLNINFFMTWMLDPSVEFYLGEPGAEIKCTKEEKLVIRNQLNRLQDYIKSNSSFFASTCLTMFTLDQYTEPLWLYSRNETIDIDRHPSPLAQYRYVQEIFKKEMIDSPFYHRNDLADNSVKWHNFLKDKEKIRGSRGNFPIEFPTSHKE